MKRRKHVFRSNCGSTGWFAYCGRSFGFHERNHAGICSIATEKEPLCRSCIRQLERSSVRQIWFHADIAVNCQTILARRKR